MNDTNCPSSSIRSLVEHVMMGLTFSSYVMQERTFQPNKIIDSFRELSKKQLLQRWLEITEDFVRAFKKSFGKSVKFRDRKIKIDEDFVFAFTNHVVYHRGQINIALKMVGEETNDADYGEYNREMNKN